MDKILISSCFLGNKVRYDGKDNLLTSDIIQRWQQEERLVIICPELAGGLSIPRAPAEIQNSRITNSKKITLQVLTNTGENVTEAFECGANEALRLCKLHKIRYALLKESSPSCGSSMVYDGSFQRRKISGQGVTTKLLMAHGIKVYSEKTIALLLTCIND